MNAKIFLFGAVVACITQHVCSSEHEEPTLRESLWVMDSSPTGPDIFQSLDELRRVVSMGSFSAEEGDVFRTPARRQSTQLYLEVPPHTDNANPVQSDFLKGLNDRVREATKSFPSAVQAQAEEITKTMNAALLLTDMTKFNEQKEALLVLIRCYFAWEQVYLLVDGAKKMADLNRASASLPSSNLQEVEQSLRSQVAEMVNTLFSSHQEEVQELVLSIVSVSQKVNSCGPIQNQVNLDALHRLFLDCSVQRSDFNSWGEKLGTAVFPLAADMIPPVAADMK